MEHRPRDAVFVFGCDLDPRFVVDPSYEHVGVRVGIGGGDAIPQQRIGDHCADFIAGDAVLPGGGKRFDPHTN